MDHRGEVRLAKRPGTDEVVKKLKNALRRLVHWKVLLRHRLPRGFDPVLYVDLNPDVRMMGVDPGVHYLLHGRREGRAFEVPALATLKAGPAPIDRPVMLLICHEASRSGAPVLGLNLAQAFRATHEVVVLLLGHGPLVADFISVADSVFLCPELRSTPSDQAAMTVVRQLCARFAFAGAIANSIECRSVLHGLASCRVPALVLVHEFAAYIRPASAFPRALFWAQKAVFSARIVRDDAFQRRELRDAANIAVLPQGSCKVPRAGKARDASQAIVLADPRGTEGPPVVHILGVGKVEYRKGVDLFIACAARMRMLDPGTDYRFHWVGAGFQPDTDLQYSAYVSDQIRRAGLAAHFRFLGETEDLEDLYRQAQLFLLTSRLDPLPNVGIDAAIEGLPILCFAETTGIADFLHQAGLDALVAAYLDTSDMAAKAVALVRSPELRETVGAALRARAADIFSLASYAASLRDQLERAAARLRQEQQDAADILLAGVLDAATCVHPAHPQLGARLADGAAAIAGTYVRAWATGLYRRKPFPGFHPAMYSERIGLGGEVDPLAHWLRGDRPDGLWHAPVLTPAAPTARHDWLRDRKVALHIHAYYPELLGEIVKRLAHNAARPHLFVTVTSAAQRAVAEAALEACPTPATLEVVPNRGRDLFPFLAALTSGAMAGYELVGHLHTKRSVDVADPELGATWYRFLLENLVGGREGGPMMDRIVTRMLADDGPAMVAPEDPYVFGDLDNAAGVAALAHRMGWPEPPRQFRFPVGSMFWARPDCLRPLLGLGFRAEDFPCEPLPYDGTLLHALERVLGLAGNAAPGGLTVTNIPGVTR